MRTLGALAVALSLTIAAYAPGQSENPAASAAPANGAVDLAASAQLVVNGKDFSLEDLRNGQPSQSKGKYTWDMVPPELAGCLCTCLAEGGKAAISVTAESDGKVYAATQEDPSPELEKAGWRKTGTSFTYTDPGKSRLRVWSKDVKAGAVEEIPQLGPAGTIVLAPEDKMRLDREIATNSSYQGEWHIVGYFFDESQFRYFEDGAWPEGIAARSPIVAVSKDFPLETILKIRGIGNAVVRQRGEKSAPKTIGICFYTTEEAKNFQARVAKVWVVGREDTTKSK